MFEPEHGHNVCFFTELTGHTDVAADSQGVFKSHGRTHASVFKVDIKAE